MSKKVPLTVDFDVMKPIGEATVHEDGRVELHIDQPEVVQWLTQDVIKEVSIGFLTD